MTENQIYGFMFLVFILLFALIFNTLKIEEKALSYKILRVISCGHFEVAGVTSEAALRKALGEVSISLFHSACEKLVNEDLLHMESVSMGGNSRKILYEITDKGKKLISDQKLKCDSQSNKSRLGEGLGM